MGETTGKRPFWMHQMVEYILGGALVATGLQSPSPIVPSVLGGGILMYAASTRGALSAFRLFDRRWHKVLDPVVIAAEVFGAVQPWVSVRNDTRFVIVAIAVVHAVVWWGSSFTEKRKPTKQEKAAAAAAAPAAPAGDRATEIGKSAGRAVGVGVNMVRKARAKRDS
jgi:hypothetical protein